VVLGVLVRTYHVARWDFPVNDGGLFYIMTRDIQASDYELPYFTSYNDQDIPFVYPPLGFYIAGLVDEITPFSLLTVFQFLPLVYASLGIVAFVFLARRFLASDVALIAATIAFALIPRSFIWLLMGGGVARALGFLFAILALERVYRLYTTRNSKYLLFAIPLGAATVLSHLETGWFLAFSTGIMFLFFGRHRRGVASSIELAAGVLLLLLPWLITALDRHGLEPFEAANASGGNVFSNETLRKDLLLITVRGISTSEPFFPVLGVLGILGGLVCLTRNQFFLPIWWLATIFLDARAFATYTTLPIAILAGLGFVEVVLPVLTRTLSRSPQPATPTGNGRNGHRPAYARWLRGHAPRWSLVGVPSVLVAFATLASLTTSPSYSPEAFVLVSVTPEQREAMRWASRETPSDSRFLVMPTGVWPADKESEWFPALSDRVSVATVQGREWLHDHEFDKWIAAHESLQTCSYASARCLDDWINETKTGFTHVYLPTYSSGECCPGLQASLERDFRYTKVYDGAGGPIFQRTDMPPTMRHDTAFSAGAWS
jgi:hypothetical protein